MGKKKAYECPFSFEDLERLELAIAEGVKEVQYNDKKVVYRSLNEMLRAANYMRTKLGLTSKNNGLFGGRRVTMRPSKGLDDCSPNDEHGEERFDRNKD